MFQTYLILMQKRIKKFLNDFVYIINNHNYISITLRIYCMLFSTIRWWDKYRFRTQSKIHGGFVTFYPTHFDHLKCGTHWGYPKYYYSKPGWKDYTIKLKRNDVMRLPNYLAIEENMVLRFLRLPSRRLPCLPLLQG